MLTSPWSMRLTVLALATLPIACADGGVPACVEDCGSCPDEQVCVTQGSFGPVLATCVAQCSSDVDCADGEVCLGNGNLNPDPTANRGMCIAEDTPTACDFEPNDYAHCDLHLQIQTECADANTLFVPTARFGLFCGARYTRCDNGCADAACR